MASNRIGTVGTSAIGGLNTAPSALAVLTISAIAKFQGRESRAEIILVNGAITGIRYTGIVGRAALEPNEMRFFQEIVTVKADEIVSKWIDFFVLHKSITPERITRRVK